MVLDERALENMLARQRASEHAHVPRESVRTEQTDEFEVYERAADAPTRAVPPLRAPLQPAAHPPAGHAPSPVPRFHEPREPTALRPEVPVARSEDFEELPGREAPTEFVPPPPFRDERPPAPMPNQAPPRPASHYAPPIPPTPLPPSAPAPVPFEDPVRGVPAAPAVPAPETPRPAAPAPEAPSASWPAAPVSEPPVPAPAAPEVPTEPVLPVAAPVAPEPVAPAPAPELPATPVAEPAWEAPAAPVEETLPEAPVEQDPEPVRRRPQVWPPIRPRAERVAAAAPASPVPAPAPAEAPPGPAVPAQTALPTEPAAPTPRTHAPTAHAFPEAGADGTGRQIAIVQAKFNAELTDEMARQAVAHAEKTGATVSHHVTVPGVYDLPLTVQQLARRKDVDGVVVIGVVVQGETKHDELITFSTAKTLQEISLATDTPIGLGIIGPGMTWEQAEARVGNGVHAVEAVLVQLAAL